VWFLVVAGTTSLVAWNPAVGRSVLPPVGLDGVPIQAAMANGTIWVAASTVVDRFSIATGRREMITLPKGMNATGVAVDPVTNTVWVGNSTPSESLP
jgi:DNA-binding beta-propeller fold protein YncE